MCVYVCACACESLCVNEVVWACWISFISITTFISRLSQSPQLSHDDTHSRIEQYASRYILQSLHHIRWHTYKELLTAFKRCTFKKLHYRNPLLKECNSASLIYLLKILFNFSQEHLPSVCTYNASIYQWNKWGCDDEAQLNQNFRQWS